MKKQKYSDVQREQAAVEKQKRKVWVDSIVDLVTDTYPGAKKIGKDGESIDFSECESPEIKEFFEEQSKKQGGK